MQSLLLILMMALPGASHEFWELLKAKQFDRAKALLDKGSYVDSKQAGSSAIHHAVESGDLEAVKFLIAQGSDVDDPDDKERTPLMIAASLGDLAMVEYLVDQGASLEAVSESGHTPLMHAMMNRRDAVVDVLLKKHSGHLFAPDREGGFRKASDVLFLSVAVWDSVAFETLFAVHPDPNLRRRSGKTLLMAAADANATRFVQRLLSLHADPSALDEDGNTALHHACERRADTSLLKLLLRDGANPNARNAEQQTPLHLAVASKNAANVRVLLREKIDLDLPDLSGKTPFGMAMVQGLEEITLLLKDKGARMVLPTKRSDDSSIVVETNSSLFANLVIAAGVDVNGMVYPDIYSGSNMYERILTIAASQGWNEVIELALAKGADPNLTNGDHLSPIDCALSHRQFGAFQLLVQRGAKVDRGSLGEHLGYLVVRNDSLNGIPALLNHGANINARDPYGQTPLMIAASCRQVGNVGVLLQSHADPTLRDEWGKSALDEAVENRCLACAKLLVEHGASVKGFFSKDQSLFASAVSRSDTLLALWLLDNGAPAILTESDYETIFGFRVESAKIARFIFRKMPKLDLDKALLYAATTTNIDLVNFLIDKGANVNARDKTGDTPLITNRGHFGSSEIYELLLRKGANPKLRDKSGKTAADHCRHSRG